MPFVIYLSNFRFVGNFTGSKITYKIGKNHNGKKKRLTLFGINLFSLIIYFIDFYVKGLALSSQFLKQCILYIIYYQLKSASKARIIACVIPVASFSLYPSASLDAIKVWVTALLNCNIIFCE